MSVILVSWSANTTTKIWKREKEYKYQTPAKRIMQWRHQNDSVIFFIDSINYFDSREEFRFIASQHNWPIFLLLFYYSIFFVRELLSFEVVINFFGAGNMPFFTVLIDLSSIRICRLFFFFIFQFLNELVFEENNLHQFIQLSGS